MEEIRRLVKATLFLFGTTGAAVGASCWVLKVLGPLDTVGDHRAAFLFGVSWLGLNLAVIKWRNSLHHKPSPLTLLLVVAVLSAALVLVSVARTHVEAKLTPEILSVGSAIVAIVVVVLLSAAVSLFVAVEHAYRRVFGRVIDAGGTVQRGVRVACQTGEYGELVSVTNRKGEFQFLLGEREALRAGWLDVRPPLLSQAGPVLVGNGNMEFPFEREIRCKN